MEVAQPTADGTKPMQTTDKDCADAVADKIMPPLAGVAKAVAKPAVAMAQTAKKYMSAKKDK